MLLSESFRIRLQELAGLETFNEVSPEQISIPKQYIHDRLNSQIWSGYKLRPEIRMKLLDISDKFYQFLEIKEPIKEIKFVGSMANFNWSSQSDIDIHLFFDFNEINKDTELVKNYLNSKRTIWNSKHNIAIKGYKVEMYCQDINENNFSVGVYDLQKNDWDKRPSYENFSIDKNSIMSKVTSIIDDIEAIDKTGTPEQIYRKGDMLKTKIKKMRQCGLEEAGEMSIDNLAFKYLRNNGYIEKLLDIVRGAFDNSLSLNENVITVYRGTDDGKEHSGTNSSWHGSGIYFTDSKTEASWYGNVVKKYNIELNNPFRLDEVEEDSSVQGSGLIKKFAQTKGLQNQSYHGKTFLELNNLISELEKTVDANKIEMWDGENEHFKHFGYEYNGKEYKIYNRTKAEYENLNNIKNSFIRDILREEYGVDDLPIRVKDAINPYSFSEILKGDGYDGIIAPNSNFSPGFEYVVFDKSQVKLLSENTIMGPKKYYNSHGSSYSWNDFVETEVIDRGNYSKAEVAKWIKKYGITKNSRLIWVATSPQAALTYDLNSESHDDIHMPLTKFMKKWHVSKDQLDSLAVFTDQSGTIIPESDDGDDGYLMVLNYTSKDMRAENI